MQVLQPGIEYLLSGSDRDGNGKPTHIKFCHKDGEGRFVQGMTSEEMLEMMINRQQTLITKENSAENIQALFHIRKALDCIKARNSIKLEKRKISENTRNGVPFQARSTKS